MWVLNNYILTLYYFILNIICLIQEYQGVTLMYSFANKKNTENASIVESWLKCCRK